MKTKIFVSYASEDEAEFAKPLADALATDFDVWFAPYKLTMGDSLLRKISEGLRECDYGVVVLSPSFFAKEWPQNELDGLFGLETEQRKVILPVWKDVTKKDVARYSPILAGRLSAQASRGIAAVVDEIKAAVGAGNRMASFSAASAIKAKFLSLDAERAHHKRAELLRSTLEGIGFAQVAVTKLMEKLQQLLTELQSGMTQLKLTIDRNDHSIRVRAPYRIQLSAAFETRYTNCLMGSALTLRIYEPPSTFDDNPENKPHQLVRTDFERDFASGDEVVWKVREGRQFSTDQLAVEILSALHNELTNAQARDQRQRDG